MSTINIKTNLQRVGFAKADKYITSTVRYSTISTDDLLEYACENSGIPKAQLISSFYAINQQIVQFILNGHSLQLGNLGFFYLSAKTKAVDSEKEAGVEAVEGLVLKFRQSRKLRNLINQRVNFSVLNAVDSTENEEDDDNSSNSGTESNPL
ncbi:hypothetical protein SFC43_05360 [Bacteroides sp. CR5/BHMF/2]|nr:hypothetical protein [Bacteroides sp. CR5/BHMF/2]